MIIESSAQLIKPNKVNMIYDPCQVVGNGTFVINEGFKNSDEQTLKFIKDRIQRSMIDILSNQLNDPNSQISNFRDRVQEDVLKEVVKDISNSKCDYYYTIGINPVKLIRNSLVLWGRRVICDYLEFNRGVELIDVTILLNIYHTILECYERGIDKWAFLIPLVEILKSERIIYEYNDMAEYSYILVQPTKTAEYLRIPNGNHEDQMGYIKYTFSRLMLDFTHGYENMIIDFSRLLDQVNYVGEIYE